MNKIPQNYVVSSAGWDIPIDHIDPYGAAVNGVACALNSFGASTLISTTVMVSKESEHKRNDFTNSHFFASHDIFRDLGCKKTSKALEDFCNAS